MLVHPPLRTARASFPACGSSLTKALSKDPAARPAIESPSQYGSAVVTPVVRWSANQWRSIVLQAGTHRTSASPLSSFAFPPWSRFHILSCDVRPVGRGLTFVPGDVPTRIRTITIRRSLLPTSQTRTAKDRPCGLSSPKGAIRGFHVPLFEFIGLGACSRPGDLRITRAEQIAALPISITFWFKRVSHFRLLNMTVFTADSHMFTLPTI